MRRTIECGDVTPENQASSVDPRRSIGHAYR